MNGEIEFDMYLSEQPRWLNLRQFEKTPQFEQPVSGGIQLKQPLPDQIREFFCH